MMKQANPDLFAEFMESNCGRQGLGLTAVFQKVPEGFIGFVEELPGANTQGATVKETRDNLREAVHLVLEANRLLSEESLRGRDVIREPLDLAHLIS